MFSADSNASCDINEGKNCTLVNVYGQALTRTGVCVLTVLHAEATTEEASFDYENANHVRCKVSDRILSATVERSTGLVVEVKVRTGNGTVSNVVFLTIYDSKEKRRPSVENQIFAIMNNCRVRLSVY